MLMARSFRREPTMRVAIPFCFATSLLRMAFANAAEGDAPVDFRIVFSTQTCQLPRPLAPSPQRRPMAARFWPITVFGADTPLAGFSRPIRFECIASTGSVAKCSPNLLYGPGSSVVDNPHADLSIQDLLRTGRVLSCRNEQHDTGIDVRPRRHEYNADPRRVGSWDSVLTGPASAVVLSRVNRQIWRRIDSVRCRLLVAVRSISQSNYWPALAHADQGLLANSSSSKT